MLSVSPARVAKGGQFRRALLQNQHGYKDSEYAVGEHAGSFGVLLACATARHLIPSTKWQIMMPELLRH
jgi:hypothetical protein